MAVLWRLLWKRPTRSGYSFLAVSLASIVSIRLSSSISAAVPSSDCCSTKSKAAVEAISGAHGSKVSQSVLRCDAGPSHPFVRTVLVEAIWRRISREVAVLPLPSP
jgi:hypothetical protein